MKEKIFDVVMETYKPQIKNQSNRITFDDSPKEKIILRLAEREEQYTDLTKNFVKINYNRYKYKEFHKWVFFWIMLAILVFVTVIFGIIAIKISRLVSSQIVLQLPILLGAYASFISTIIAIPLLIGKYLFNKEEESNLGKIVENMQAYDRKGQKLFKSAFDNDYRNHEK